MQYRTKPVIVTAVKYETGMEDGWVVEGRYYPKTGPVPKTLNRKPAIETYRLGAVSVAPGDWIITDVKGERYPCKPDVFEQTYEAVEC